MLAVDQRAELADGAQLPESALVLGTAGREVPQGATRVTDHGQTGRLELLQESLQTAVLPENPPDGNRQTDGRTEAREASTVSGWYYRNDCLIFFYLRGIYLPL